MCGPPSLRKSSQAPKAILDHIQQHQAPLSKQLISGPGTASLNNSADTSELLPTAKFPQAPTSAKAQVLTPLIQNLPVAGLEDSVEDFSWCIFDSTPAQPSTGPPSYFPAPELDEKSQELSWLAKEDDTHSETKAAPTPPSAGSPSDEAACVDAASCGSKAGSPNAEAQKPLLEAEHEAADTIEEGECKPYTEKLPKDLLNHPCAATLLSAGIRIKGRTREELIEVAEKIKKRRRASAARCRARKATRTHNLEDENVELKKENARLKQQISELHEKNASLAAFIQSNMPQLSVYTCAAQGQPMPQVVQQIQQPQMQQPTLQQPHMQQAQMQQAQMLQPQMPQPQMQQAQMSQAQMQQPQMQQPHVQPQMHQPQLQQVMSVPSHQTDPAASFSSPVVSWLPQTRDPIFM